MSKISTVVDKDGDVWTGKTVEKSSSVMDLVVGIVCPPALPAMLSSSGKTTVVVNGEKHTGSKVK